MLNDINIIDNKSKSGIKQFKSFNLDINNNGMNTIGMKNPTPNRGYYKSEGNYLNSNVENSKVYNTNRIPEVEEST